MALYTEQGRHGITLEMENYLFSLFCMNRFGCMFGMVWFGLVWFCMVWNGLVWHGLVWFDML